MPEDPQILEANESHATTVRDSLSSGVLAGVLARVGYLVTRFFIPPFVLAHVSMEAYGLWATAFIVVSYIGVSTMGLSNVYVKYVAEYSARRDYRKANELLSTGLCFSVPGCFAVFGALYVLWPRVVEHLHIGAALRSDAREVVLTVAAIFLSSISLSAFHDALVGVQRTALVQIIWVVTYLVETALIFLLVGMGRGIRGLAEAFLARTALDIVLCLVISLRTLRWLRPSPTLCTREAFRVLVTFGSVVQVQSLLAVALNSIERALAAPLVGLSATGLMDVGNKMPSMAASIPLSFASAFVPAASYLQGGLNGTSEQREAIRKLYLKGARYMNILTSFICGFLALMPAPILDTWVGKHFEGAAYLMIIFSVSSNVNLMTGPGTSILKGIGLPNAEFFYCLPNVLALVIIVPASHLILGQWTAAGIATAVVLSTIVAAVFFLRHANRLLEVPVGVYMRKVIAPGLAPYLVAAPFAPVAYYLLAHFSRWITAAGVAGLGAVYSLVMLLVIDRFILEQGERLWFRAVISQKLAKLRGKQA
jgi:O-antigen/teichoic acid export membrane protein